MLDYLKSLQMFILIDMNTPPGFFKLQIFIFGQSLEYTCMCTRWLGKTHFK